MKIIRCLTPVCALFLAACNVQTVPPTDTPLPTQTPSPTSTATATETPTPMVTQQFPLDGLTAYYPFEGNAADASGYHNDGTLYGPTPTSDRFGHANSAYFFDGEDDYILVPDNDSLEFSADFSLALWLQPNVDNTPQSDFLLYKIFVTDPPTGITDAWWFGLMRDNANRLIFSTAPSFDHDSVTSHGIPNDAWSCVVFTYQASDQIWNYYINGSLDSQGTNDRRQIGNPAPITIGGMIEDPRTMFSGSMDDIAIYQRTLGAEEVRQYCDNQAGTPPISTGPAAATPVNTPPHSCAENWTRLRIGGYAVVTDGEPNRVRSEPTTSAEIIAQIYPGTIVRILEGPVCADGLVFWRVENNAIPSGSGWTAEGDGLDYYLEPYGYQAEPQVQSGYGVSFTIPGEWSGSPVVEKDPEHINSEYREQSRPECIIISLTNYPISGSNYEPQVWVCPLARYAEINPQAASILDSLQQGLAGSGNLIYIGPLPRLTDQDRLFIESKLQTLRFSNGNGIRRIQEWVGTPLNDLPVANESLIYTYLGITDDGEHVVSANFPVRLAFLCDKISVLDNDTAECNLPADGIPFRYEADMNWGLYYEQVNTRIDATPAGQFSPILAQLDAVIQSMTVSVP